MKEGKKIKSRAILVFGAPYSGKTTFGEKFAKRFQAPFYDLGKIMTEHKISHKMLLFIVEQIAKTGQTLVFEGCMDTEKDRVALRNILRAAGYEPSLIWVQTDINTIKSRMRTRYKSASKAKADYEDRIGRMEAPTEAEAPIVLSGKHTFETQLRQVLSQLQ